MEIPKVSEFMSKDLILFKKDQTLEEVVGTMLDRGITGGPVVDDDGLMIGMISQKDCLRASIGAIYMGAPCGIVDDNMSRIVKVLSPDDNLIDVASEFTHCHYHRFPVIDSDDKLVGVVTRTDTCRMLKKLKGKGLSFA